MTIGSQWPINYQHEARSLTKKIIKLYSLWRMIPRHQGGKGGEAKAGLDFGEGGRPTEGLEGLASTSSKKYYCVNIRLLICRRLKSQDKKRLDSDS